MFYSLFRVVLALSTISLTACSTVLAPAPVSPGASVQVPPVPTIGVPPSQGAATPAPASTLAGTEPLLPDPAAEFTTADTARLSGGEFVGDQADLTVEQAVRLGVNADQATYAFLVAITGLDDASFHYNALNFQLIDDQSFQYDALPGRQQPELDFGDLAPNQRVRGWLTFEASSTTATLELQYSPVMALEPATFGFLVP
jgi:hypothetical protein